jgi:hypothetical protein
MVQKDLKIWETLWLEKSTHGCNSTAKNPHCALSIHLKATYEELMLTQVFV